MKCLVPVLAALALFTGLAHASDRVPFTATYDVVRSGKRVGKANMSLQRDGGNWRFTSVTHASLGPGGLLGIDTTETSLFRWKQYSPEMLAYDFRLDSSLKKSHRHTEADWSAQRVHVDDSGKGRSDYASEPGLVERHLLALALGQALLHGDNDEIDFAVAVRDHVEHQTFRVDGPETVDVPAGRFDDAWHVERSDRDRGFNSWYAPERYPVPLMIRYGDRMELRLATFVPGPVAATRDD